MGHRWLLRDFHGIFIANRRHRWGIVEASLRRRWGIVGFFMISTTFPRLIEGIVGASLGHRWGILEASLVSL